ncbi:hypothetical protein [Roseomonas sp. USHLN139]|uniref:hypothetical protein n=1 Tax=Roseomonas sp. USHLN139 TaxID=3081298 RepID=UPI003B027DF9
MFLDLPGGGPPRPPELPPPPRLSPQRQRLLLWIIGLNVLLLLVAPIGGATLITGLLALLR